MLASVLATASPQPVPLVPAPLQPKPAQEALADPDSDPLELAWLMQLAIPSDCPRPAETAQLFVKPAVICWVPSESRPEDAFIQEHRRT